MSVPLSEIAGIAGSRVAVERSPSGWYLAAPHGLAAKVKGFRDGIICRIGLGARRDRWGRNKDREVVQLGIGPATSKLCNAIYSPKRDIALEFDAEGLLLEPIMNGTRVSGFRVSCTGPLTVTEHRDYIRVERGYRWYQPLDRTYHSRPPAGWCSWYYYYSRVTEADIVRNTDWLAQNLRQFGCEWVQIDDGWQGTEANGKWGRNRDWYQTNESKFPRGMQYCAEYIRSKGLRPGLWLMPFSQSRRQLFAERPQMFVKKADGSSIGERTAPFPAEWWWREETDDDGSEVYTTWPGRYILDPTSEDSRQYLRDLFEMVCNQWGYDYIKTDAQLYSMQLMAQGRGRFADPSLDSEWAYRRGLQVIASAMGRERFLLNCASNYTSCGFAQGIRTGGDVSLKWEDMLEGFGATMQFLFLNTIAFYTDPDVVCVREPLDLERARLWTALLGVTGQLVMSSDDMPALPDDRVELLRRIYPVADIHPMELYPLHSDPMPGIFVLKVRIPQVADWDVVAVFNWSEKEARRFTLSPERLGLEDGDWLCIDGQTGKALATDQGRLEVEVCPTSCKTISYWPDLGRPQLLGTSRHLTQGAVDVSQVTWDAGSLTLKGRSRVVGGDPYRLRVRVPHGYRIVSPEVTWDGDVAQVEIRRDANQQVNWTMKFTLGQP